MVLAGSADSAAGRGVVRAGYVCKYGQAERLDRTTRTINPNELVERVGRTTNPNDLNNFNNLNTFIMENKNFRRYAGEACSAIVFALLRAQYQIDRQVFFLTGARMPLLKAVWKEQAERLQKALDRQPKNYRRFTSVFAK